jgi:hypothetical protein
MPALTPITDRDQALTLHHRLERVILQHRSDAFTGRGRGTVKWDVSPSNSIHRTNGTASVRLGRL